MKFKYGDRLKIEIVNGFFRGRAGKAKYFIINTERYGFLYLNTKREIRYYLVFKDSLEGQYIDEKDLKRV